MNRHSHSAPCCRRLSRTAGWLLCACLPLSPHGLTAQSTASAGGSPPSILDRSPFLPPDFQPPSQRTQPRRPQPAEQNSYEFRGVYQLAGEYRFLIAEARSREGDWVSLQRPGDNYQIKHYDPQTQVLTILANNKEEQLELAQLNPDTKPIPVQGQSTAAAPSRPSSAQPADSGNTSPRRRVIRPTSRTSSNTTNDSATPDNTGQAKPATPAWLQQLRERAAQRREAARKAREQREP